MTTMANDFNSTLNLPKTAFPMRANLAQREPQMLEKLYADHIYEALTEKNKDCEPFILHDGPPFSNGDIHIGTAMNKMLKDIVLRSKAMSGHYTPYTPGWDNHGMPIESAIIKKNKLNRKAMSIPEFRNACRDFAWDFVCRQRDEFKRLGVLGDWEHPYLTMDKEFEAEEIKIFGEMYRKGYIYRGMKPVYWCPFDETALAEAEIEYQDEPCTSIYVRFKVVDDKGLLDKKEVTSFVIWTTTPWTLPGNVCIALAPRADYVVVELASGERLILAEELLKKTMEQGGIDKYEIVARFKGSELEGMTTQHPFLDRLSGIVLADYVTTEDGTGCVHTAPGYGAEDYLTGRKYDLPMLVPVDDHGYQTEGAGRFAGMRYDESNKAIVDYLRDSGALFASKELTHSYPHCWRCKNPIIFRATPQWFCSVKSFRDETLEEIKKIKWLPAWGEDRISNMVSERDDWCISRQRHWGLPIPVFYCEDCGEPVCTPESIEFVSDLFKEHGSNVWYERDADGLLPEGFKCPHCGKTHFRKETDTLDGWFDSGSTHIASLKREHPENWPADLYQEGNDQYRGWFQSSLLISMAVLGQSPYKQVITHGWTVDGEGRAMHKSLGNGVAPADVIKDYGADILRLWVASSDYKQDVRVSDDILKQLSQAYMKIRNTARYILGNLEGFDPNHPVSPDEMLPLDKWALGELDELVKRVQRGYDDYEYHIVYHAVYDFCVVELSSFYLDVIKDRLYCDEKDGVSRRSAQTAMWMILDALTKQIAPILAFTSDEIWQEMPHRSEDDPRHVVLNRFASVPKEYLPTDAERERWSKIIELRETANAELEKARAAGLIGKPLEAKVVFSATGDELEFIKANIDDLTVALIVSQVEAVEGESGVTVGKAEGEKCPRCWAYHTHVDENGLCERCAAAVKAINE